MPDEPFDWERDDERRGAGRPGDHWYRQADNTALLAGQFWALWDRHMHDFRLLVEEVHRNEQRLVEERAKDLAADLFTTTVGRVFLIVLGVIGALAVAKIGFNPFEWSLPWGG